MVSATPQDAVVDVMARAWEKSSRKWREPEEHAAAVLAALEEAGWVILPKSRTA